jgi:hypothetical protein
MKANDSLSVSIPKTTQSQIEHYKQTCLAAGVIFRGVQAAFALPDGSVHPALILFDGAYDNTIGLPEPRFNEQAVRVHAAESNALFAKSYRINHRSGQEYCVGNGDNVMRRKTWA